MKLILLCHLQGKKGVMRKFLKFSQISKSKMVCEVYVRFCMNPQPHETYLCVFLIFNKHNLGVQPWSAPSGNLLTRHHAPSDGSSTRAGVHQTNRRLILLPLFFFCCFSCRQIKLSLRCYQQLSKIILYSDFYFVFRKHKSISHSHFNNFSHFVCSSLTGKQANHQFVRLYLTHRISRALTNPPFPSCIFPKGTPR